jgi:heptosyltransferase-1
MALVRRAQLFVGGDSGPMHLAAALGVPVVALFGPTDPLRNGPWGPGAKAVVRDTASLPSYKRSHEVDPGLAKVSVERVMEAVRSIL